MLKFIKTYLLVLFTFTAFSQQGDYFLSIKRYPFIQYDNNQLLTPADSNYLESLYQKMDSIVLYGKGKLNIVHIGGSHIQADIYTHQIRKRLQSLEHCMNGGRGFIFPYSIAKTNKPSNFRLSYSGEWTYCKNTKYQRTCELGLSGISVTTTSEFAAIQINLNRDSVSAYTYTKLKVFHPKSAYELCIKHSDSTHYGTYDSIAGFSYFEVSETDSLNLVLEKPDSVNASFTLYGLLFENDNPGIVYHSIGVNGAKLESYLYCGLYEQQLAEIKPDLVIFSVGTNDGNTKYFNTVKYHSEYYNLIQRTKEAFPGTKIMITVPNDAYYYKRYVNKNTLQIQKVILSLANENNWAVWDFFYIMGGLDSSQKWYNYDLMRYDRIHFNQKGYLLKGDLFVTALLRGWERNLTSRKAMYNKPIRLTQK